MSNLLDQGMQMFQRALSVVNDNATAVTFRNPSGDTVKAECLISSTGRFVERSEDGIMVSAAYREYTVTFMPSSNIPDFDAEFMWKGRSMTLMDVQNYHGQYIGFAVGHG